MASLTTYLCTLSAYLPLIRGFTPKRLFYFFLNFFLTDFVLWYFVWLSLPPYNHYAKHKFAHMHFKAFTEHIIYTPIHSIHSSIVLICGSLYLPSPISRASHSPRQFISLSSHSRHLHHFCDTFSYIPTHYTTLYSLVAYIPPHSIFNF